MATTYQPAAKTGKPNESWESAKEAGSEGFERVKDAGREGMAKLQETAQQVKAEGAQAWEKVKDAGGDVLGKARETAQSVGAMAAQTACAVGSTADDVTAAAGHGITGLGERMADRGPQAGVSGRATHAVADTIKGTGHYIEEHKLSGIAHDLEQVVKNHPIPMLFLGIGLGYCLARAFKD